MPFRYYRMRILAGLKLEQNPAGGVNPGRGY
jgi:hypothetical protein